MSKFSKYMIVIVGSLFLLCSFAGCSSTVSLLPVYKPGQHYSLNVHQSSNLNMLMFPGVDVKDSDLVLDVYVLGVDAEKIATVEVTIASIKASLKSLSVHCSYDSENPTATEQMLRKAMPSDKEKSSGAAESSSPLETLSKARKTQKAEKHQQRYETAFEGLKGKSYRALVNAKGQVIELKIEDQRLRAIADRSVKGMLGEDQLSMLLSAAAMKEYVVPGAVSSKSKADSKSTWTGPVTIDVPRAESVDVPCTYTLLDKKQADPNITGVCVKTMIDSKPDPANPSEAQTPTDPVDRHQPMSGFVIVAAKGEGNMVFSKDSGNLIRDEQTLKVEVITARRSRLAARSGENHKPARTFTYTVKRTIERIKNP